MRRSWKAWALGALVATLAGPAVAADKMPYIPWTDPAEPLVDGQPVVRRGDQRHPSRAPAERGDGPGTYRVRDFRWNMVHETEGRWRDHWRPVFGGAVLDTSRVTGVSLLLYPFAPKWVAGHTALWFRTAPGGVVPGADLSGSEELGAAPTGFVISLEAWMKQGEKYGFKDGILGNFPVVYSMSTMENYVQRCIDVYQGVLKVWHLDLTAEEARSYARASLDITLANHRGETYWLTRNSCSTAVMDMLIAGLKEHKRWLRVTRREEVSAARDAQLAALEESNRATREISDAQLNAALESWDGGLMDAAGEFVWDRVTFTWTRKLLGIHRESVRRESPLGIFVNPLMSFPAMVPGVLARRGFLDDPNSPDQIYEYLEPATGAPVGEENTRDPSFSQLSGS